VTPRFFRFRFCLPARQTHGFADAATHMVSSAVLALTAGVVWDTIGPQYIFLSFVAVDLLIRLPLLVSVPETLRVPLETRAGA